MKIINVLISLLIIAIHLIVSILAAKAILDMKTCVATLLLSITLVFCFGVYGFSIACKFEKWFNSKLK